MRIVCLSDTHNLHHRMIAPVPDGDILIHAGDLTNTGEISDVISVAKWGAALPHLHKLIIAGNHDYCFDPNGRRKCYTPRAAEILSEHGWVYLEDSGTTIEGIQFYGSPWQPWFYDWAFNAERGAQLAGIWEQIPDETTVLITHGPPAGILDWTAQGSSVGCANLLARVQKLSPPLHVFGHIHEAYGTKKSSETLYVNPSICTLQYQPINSPVVVELTDLKARVITKAS